MAEPKLPRVVSMDRVIDIPADRPTLVKGYNIDSWSWDITNDSATALLYKRGASGRDIGTTGEPRGITIPVSGADGMDRFDAIDEVWAISSAAINFLLSETIFPGWVERFRVV